MATFVVTITYRNATVECTRTQQVRADSTGDAVQTAWLNIRDAVPNHQLSTHGIYVSHTARQV